MRSIMLVDDEENVLQALRRVLVVNLSAGTARVEAFTDPHQALARAHEQAFDVVVSDLRMPLMDGIALLEGIKHAQPCAARMILSAMADRDVLVQAINRAEIVRFIDKPWQVEGFMHAIRWGFAHHDQLLEDRCLADEVRMQRGALSPQEHERRRLEEQEPGITRVKWGPDGSVLLDAD